ncbi:MAG: hypothetical protein AAF514_02135 [Verrucomicrobiota bacterium]
MGSFDFSMGAGSRIVGLILLVLVLVFAFAAWRRRPSRTQLALESLRILLALMGLLTLWRIEWKTVLPKPWREAIVVLEDRSQSMETRDVPGEEVGELIRRDAVLENLAAARWTAPLEERFALSREPFSEAAAAALPEERGTDLNGALARVLERGDSVRAVVVMTDGDWNEGGPPAEAARLLQQRGVPVFSVPLGGSIPLPDVALEEVSLPKQGAVGQPLLISFSLHNRLSRTLKTTITVSPDRGEPVHQDVVVEAGKQLDDSILWTPADEGVFQLQVAVPVEEGELRKDNNQETLAVEAKREALKVLVIDSVPRWEYRFLRNALSRDPGVTVRCLLFHPGLDPGGGLDYLDAFPPDKEAMGEYDVVFLGDVGLNPGQLTEEDLDRIKGLVEQQAGGLVFMPGLRGDQRTVWDSSLESLLPVRLDAGQAEGFGEETPFSLVLTGSGKSNLLTLLTDEVERNADVWRSLPGFYWHAPVLRSRPGSRVLAVHEARRNDAGRLPLLVTRPVGRGKVLFLGTDGAWRWRRGVEDRYHYRFWSQVVRWMAYQRHMANGERVRLMVSPERPRTGQLVTVNAVVMNDAGEPLDLPNVELEVIDPRSQLRKLPLDSDGTGWGAYHQRLSVEFSGSHALRIRLPDSGEVFETDLEVRPEIREKIGLPARPEVLEELAAITGGKVVAPGEVVDLVNQLEALPRPEPEVRRLQMWCHPLWMALFLGFFVFFWVGRKRLGLI